jgi:hypothetical protein
VTSIQRNVAATFLRPVLDRCYEFVVDPACLTVHWLGV